MKRFGFVRLILCLSVFIFSVHEASALDATLSGDASVNSAHPGVNYGALSNLYVGNGNTAFLQFDLSSLPAGTIAAQVSHATLTVFVNRVNVAGSVTVSPVTASWGEYSVTSTTAPAAGGSIGTLPVSTAGQFVSVDITAQVQAWINTPASNNGLALTSSAANALLDSKENDETAHAAQLDITLVNQGSQGIQGVQGVPGTAGAAGAIGPQGPIGAPGIPGAPGAIGPVGPTGATGAIGATGPQGPPVSFQGVWGNATTYSTGDAVSYNGSSYISLQNANIGNNPATAPAEWSLLAQQGAIGPQGPIGLTGTTGATGVAGPAGATGSQGVVGPQGPQGPPVSFIGPWNNSTPYSIGSAVSEGGTSYIALTANTAINPATDVGGNWAVLAQAGTAGTVAVGTTTTGASGSSASVTNSGTSSAAILNFTIPQGPAGPAGVAGPSGPSGAVGPVGPAGASGGGVNAVSYAMQFINPGTTGTYYLSPLNVLTNLSGSTTLGSNFVAMPAACTMSALNVGVNSYSAQATDTTTMTVYRNGSATTMSCAVTTDGSNSYRSSCQDITHTFSVVGGDAIAVVFSESNINPVNKVTVELVCQ